MQTDSQKDLSQITDMGRLRKAFFPIMNWELPKFLPMAAIIFLTIYNFTMLRTIKDAFVVPNTGGAETLAYIKAGMVLPLSILGSLLYIKIRGSSTFERTYYFVVAFFLSFFMLFWQVLYPNMDSLHMSQSAIESLQASYPVFRFVIPIIGKWVYAFYYAFAELWGSFCLSVLFWQFANDNCGPHEAKRFYPLFILCGNIANLALSFFTEHLATLPTDDLVTEASEMTLVTGVIMVLVFRWMNRSILTQEQYRSDVLVRKKKVKLSFKESMRHLVKSKYVLYIAVLILSYGIITNLVEQTWKAEVKTIYSTEQQWLGFMAFYQRALAIASIVFVYISKGIISRYGWRACALITPICLGITGVVFFSYILFDQSLAMLIATIFMDPVIFASWFGGVGVLLSKSAKYSFFDPSKEMAFIPLDDDLRVSGKAAADGVGARLGKSAGGLIQIGLFTVLPASTQHSIAPYLGLIVVVLTGVWLVSVFRLNVLYQAKTKEAMIESGESA
ncbi:NTP/NDP exchange transporter [Gammaproteobacteria bacterium]|nr:NTP/NDP exchange transporter [Gammaproteobacteria bacterium]